MKTPLLFSFIFLCSCSIELPEPAISLRSDYITYSPPTGCAGQEVTVTFDNGYGNNCGTSRLQQLRNGTWITVMEAEPQNGVITYSFMPVAAGSYRFRASWNKSGRLCPQDNIKPFEEDPLIVEQDCCRDYFTVTAICDPRLPCPYGVEIHFNTTMDTWISITGVLPAGYQFCGFYDEFGNIIDYLSGNTAEIVGDFYACYDVELNVYFSSPDPTPVFGSWSVMDMHGLLYTVVPQPCE